MDALSHHGLVDPTAIALIMERCPSGTFHTKKHSSHWYVPKNFAFFFSHWLYPNTSFQPFTLVAHKISLFFFINYITQASCVNVSYVYESKNWVRLLHLWHVNDLPFQALTVSNSNFMITSPYGVTHYNVEKVKPIDIQLGRWRETTFPPPPLPPTFWAIGHHFTILTMTLSLREVKMLQDQAFCEDHISYNYLDFSYSLRSQQTWCYCRDLKINAYNSAANMRTDSRISMIHFTSELTWAQ